MKKKPIIIAINKWDLIEKDNNSVKKNLQKKLKLICHF